eukprot:symbB.v1.2.020968.t3/scaffold1791.1/size101237/8
MSMAYKLEVGEEMPDKRMMKQGLADMGPAKHSGEAQRHPVERLLTDHSRREQQQEMMNKALVRQETMSSEEDICAGCSLHPLEVSLVLICNHRLCLKCAHWHMHVSEAKGSKLFEAPSYTASCPSCGSATQVEAGAAQQILSMQSSPDIQPVPSSISPVERRTQRSVREGRWTQSPDPEAIERVLPKPRSPLTSNLSNLPSSPEAELQRCGQCQVEAADVRMRFKWS